MAKKTRIRLKVPANRSKRSKEENDRRWSLFLRQRRLKDQLRRLRNDFKNCYCPPVCQGSIENHAPVYPTALPAQPIHGPYVAADSDLPDTYGRPEARRDKRTEVLAEARGTSDILLHRDRVRATLRMSLQFYRDPDGSGLMGHLGEMFLTRHGQQEQFIGFIHAWRVRRIYEDPSEESPTWEDLLVGQWGEDNLWQFGHTIADMRSFFTRVYGFVDQGDVLEADEPAGNLLPRIPVRRHFAAPWARLNDNNDILYIPTIWLSSEVRTLPYQSNIRRLAGPISLNF